MQKHDMRSTMFYLTGDIISRNIYHVKRFAIKNSTPEGAPFLGSKIKK